MSEWTITDKCKCGGELQRDLSDPLPGLIGMQCPICGEIDISRISNAPKKRGKTEAIELAILRVFRDMRPQLTIRQIFYQLTVMGAIPKTEAGYRATCYHLANMRRSGAVPYGWLADSTRWQRKPRTHPSLEHALEEMQRYYRRDLWLDANAHVEIWVEKDALAGVLFDVTSEYDVGLFVARGYASMTFIHETAEHIKAIGKPTYIYHFGDFDPSGVDAAYNVRNGLLEHGADIHFERAAVTEEQITRLKLPTRPTKKTDTRAKSWGNKPSVELDAIPAPLLRGLAEDCIKKHLDPLLLFRNNQIEKRERETLAAVREQFGTSTK